MTVHYETPQQMYAGLRWIRELQQFWRKEETMQTKTTHTPGPWTAERVPERKVTINGYAIRRYGILAYCENEADAALIAAAPALLEALEALRDTIGRLRVYDHDAATTKDIVARLDQARAAIAQAKGEAS